MWKRKETQDISELNRRKLNPYVHNSEWLLREDDKTSRADPPTLLVHIFSPSKLANCSSLPRRILLSIWSDRVTYELLVLNYILTTKNLRVNANLIYLVRLKTIKTILSILWPIGCGWQLPKNVSLRSSLPLTRVNNSAIVLRTHTNCPRSQAKPLFETEDPLLRTLHSKTLHPPLYISNSLKLHLLLITLRTWKICIWFRQMLAVELFS